MPFILKHPITVSPSGCGRFEVFDTATGQPLSLDFHDLSLLLWIADGGISLPEGSFYKNSPSATAQRIQRLIESGVIIETELLVRGPKVFNDVGTSKVSRKPPVFIASSYRSGSTLLRYILDAHPELLCPPESKFISGLLEFLNYPQAFRGLQSLGFESADTKFEIRRLIEAFIGGCATASGKRRWIDKTPNYYRHLNGIDEIFNGQVQYIIMVRHPLDCIDSLVNFFPQESENSSDIVRKVRNYGKGKFGWAKFWVEVYDKLHLFSQSFPERVHIVHYESLVTDPVATIEKIFAFIDEVYPASILEDAFKSNHRFGFQDLKILNTQSIHLESIGRWQEWPKIESDSLWQIVGETAEKFGYTGYNLSQR
jgi:hypothetical protein